MAFNKENFYQEGNSEEYFVGRTNPLANPANAEILKIEECGSCTLELVAELYSGMGVVGLSLGSPTNDYDFKFIKLQVTDGAGNFVTAVGTGVNPTIVVSSTSLVGSDWKVTIIMETGEGNLITCSCKAVYNLDWNGSTIMLDTVALNAPVLAIYELDGSVAVTSINLGDIPNNSGDYEFKVELHNVGSTVLTVASATAVADIVSATLPAFAGVIYPNQKYVLTAYAKTSYVSTGTQTGSIDFVSNGGNITLDVKWTIV